LGVGTHDFFQQFRTGPPFLRRPVRPAYQLHLLLTMQPLLRCPDTVPERRHWLAFQVHPLTDVGQMPGHGQHAHGQGRQRATLVLRTSPAMLRRYRRHGQWDEIRAITERTSQVLEEFRDSFEVVTAMVGGPQPVVGDLGFFKRRLGLEANLWLRQSGWSLETEPDAEKDNRGVQARFDVVFLAARELVRNITAHTGGAGPKVVRMRLMLEDDQLMLVVQDSGRGFPQLVLEEFGASLDPYGENAQRHGLATIRILAVGLKGSLTLCNRSQGGAEVRLCVPGALMPT